MKLLGILLLILIFGLLHSCGEPGGDNPETAIRPVTPGDGSSDEELEEFLKNQDVICEDRGACPESIGKVIVLNSNSGDDISTNIFPHRFCTGTLVGKDILMTSASCLTPQMRSGTRKCENLFVVFAAVNEQLPKQVLGCERVLDTTRTEELNKVKLPLFRNDYAFIKLKGVVQRFPSFLGTEGISNGVYRAWKVDVEDKNTGVIRSENCSPRFNTFVNPFATTSYSPFIPFSDCPFYDGEFSGNTGAPLMDSRGFVAGIVSAPISQEMVEIFEDDDLMTEEASPIVHVTNVSCLGRPGQVDKQSGKNPGCRRSINRKLLADLQSKLISSEELFAETKRRVSNDVLNYNNYFKYEVEMEYTEDADNMFVRWFEPKLKPVCFDNYEEWIGRRPFRSWFKYKSKYIYYPSHGNWRIYLKFDRYFYPQARALRDIGSKEYVVQFSPKDLKESGQSTVFVKFPPPSNRPPNGNPSTEFPEMKDCSVTEL
jgi:hypothetical protein